MILHFDSERVMGVGKSRTTWKANFVGELLRSSHLCIYRDSINKIWKAQRRFFDEAASQGSQ